MKAIRFEAVVDSKKFDIFVNPDAVDTFYALGTDHTQMRLRSGVAYVINENTDNVAHALEEGQ